MGTQRFVHQTRGKMPLASHIIHKVQEERRNNK